MSSEWHLSIEASPYEYFVTCLKDEIHKIVLEAGATPIDWGGGASMGSWAGSGNNGADIYEQFQADSEVAKLIKTKVSQLARREVYLAEVDEEDSMIAPDEAQALVMARIWPRESVDVLELVPRRNA